MKSDRLSSIQRQILVGTLLGDAHLRANRAKTKYQYVVLQSESHKEYVHHLYEIFKGFTKSAPRRYVFKDKRKPGKSYVRWSFYTTFQACFRFYAHQFYIQEGFKRRKTVPKLVHRWLTPRAIAYWYLGVRFCTDSFTPPEVDLLLLVLKNKFLLETSVQKKGIGKRIYVKSGSYPALRDLISPFLIESMAYKFPTPKSV